MKHSIDNRHRVDIQALMRALPVSGLKPQCMGSIGGLIDGPKDRRWQETIELLEPPASKRAPYIEPAKALEKLLRSEGVAAEDADVRAREAVARMKNDVAEDCWVNFFDDLDPESPEYLPVSNFVAWLRDERRRSDQLSGAVSLAPRSGDELLVPSCIVDFLEQAAEVAASTPMFRGPDNWNEAWSLQDLPMSPPPKAMIEFVPGAPWADIDDWGDRKASGNPFLRWREAIRPIALELEKAIGEPVYYFADLNSDIDDDNVHRFLVLHWCCTWTPKSAFVRYLLKVSGARNVEELKAALVDPASYTQPFTMNDAFIALAALTCHIDYLAPEARKTVAVVFFTQQAREVAQSLLAQKIGAHAFIVAPKELANADWVRQATRYCRDWTVRDAYDGKLDDPIDILAVTDVLYVIANEPTPKSGFDLQITDPVEDLLWLALDLAIEASYLHVEGTQLTNPQLSLRKRGAPERVAARQARRAAFIRKLTEIRLDNDFGSSGLWDAKGRNLGYDLLDLPFPLVRRVAAWQRDYDETMNPPDMGDDAWWEKHQQQERDIASALQAALGKGFAVKLYRRHGWLTIDEIDGSKGEQT